MGENGRKWVKMVVQNLPRPLLSKSEPLSAPSRSTIPQQQDLGLSRYYRRVDTYQHYFWYRFRPTTSQPRNQPHTSICNTSRTLRRSFFPPNDASHIHNSLRIIQFQSPHRQWFQIDNIVPPPQTTSPSYPFANPQNRHPSQSALLNTTIGHEGIKCGSRYDLNINKRRISPPPIQFPPPKINTTSANRF